MAALIYAKVVAQCLARLLELSLEEQHRRHAATQLALILTLARAAPLLLTYSHLKRGTTLEQLERRMMNFAAILARSRNQRRERTRRKREQALGHAT